MKRTAGIPDSLWSIAGAVSAGKMQSMSECALAALPCLLDAGPQGPGVTGAGLTVAAPRSGHPDC